MIEDLTTEPLFVLEFSVDHDAARALGTTAAGFRGVYPMGAGTFEGTRLRGVVDAGGADWVTHRGDGLMLIDARVTLTTDDGASIGMAYTGVARARTAELMARFRNREVLGHDDLYLRTTPRFETGDERYVWLNGIVAVANGERTATGGRYHVFEVT